MNLKTSRSLRILEDYKIKVLDAEKDQGSFYKIATYYQMQLTKITYAISKYVNFLFRSKVIVQMETKWCFVQT